MNIKGVLISDFSLRHLRGLCVLKRFKKVTVVTKSKRRDFGLLLLTLLILATASAIKAQSDQNRMTDSVTPLVPVRSKKLVLPKRHPWPPPIPPVTVLHNPEYISGEASIEVAANSNPLIRIGIAQNGVTLIEFPSADRFFAIHSGNSDLVTVEKSPSLKRDHHLVLRAGSGFVVLPIRKKTAGPLPATSIVAQMDSGMAITFMVYPVRLLKQQAHRLVVRYNPDQVISSRRALGLATHLVSTEANSSALFDAVQSESRKETDQPAAVSEPTLKMPEVQKPDFKQPAEAAVTEAVNVPRSFKRWSEPRHGLRISSLAPRELSDSVCLVVFAVQNIGLEPLRLISGYPDLYIETLNDNRRPVEVGSRVEKLYLASSSANNLIPPGRTLYFAVAYGPPILGAQQHLKIVVAHMTAADEPATADLTALAK